MNVYQRWRTTLFVMWIVLSVCTVLAICLFLANSIFTSMPGK